MSLSTASSSSGHAGLPGVAFFVRGASAPEHRMHPRRAVAGAVENRPVADGLLPVAGERSGHTLEPNRRRQTARSRRTTRATAKRQRTHTRSFA